MKFVTIKIPCTVEHHEVGHEDHDLVLTALELRVTAGDRETTRDVLTRISEKFDAALNLIDIGDCT